MTSNNLDVEGLDHALGLDNVFWVTVKLTRHLGPSSATFINHILTSDTLDAEGLHHALGLDEGDGKVKADL